MSRSPIIKKVSIYLCALCGSWVSAYSVELPASPEEFVRRFALSLGEEKADSLQSLFLPLPELQAQARTLFSMARGLALADRRQYSAPDLEPVHAFVKVRLDSRDDGPSLVLGLRLEKGEGGWRVVRSPALRSLAQGSRERKEGLRSEIETLQAMLEGVSDFVSEMSEIYAPKPAPIR